MSVTLHRIEASIGDIALDPKTATVKLDETFSSYASASLTVPVAADVHALDPRERIYADLQLVHEYGRTDRAIDLGRRWAGLTAADIDDWFYTRNIETAADFSAHLFWPFDTPGVPGPYIPPFIRAMQLGLRERVIGHEAAEVRLEFASDEARLRDNAHLGAVPINVTGVSTLAGACRAILNRIDATLAPVNVDPAAEAWPFVPDQWPWNPGVDAFAFLLPIVQQAGFKLWCDELRVWHLQQETDRPGPAVTLAADEDVTRAEDAIRRSDFYNAAVITYRWTDSEGKSREAVDTAWVELDEWGDQRAYTATYQRPYPGPGVAARVLRSLLKRGRQVTVTAVSDYRLSPGTPTVVELPSTPVQETVASIITWSFPNAEMDVRTRDAVDAGEPTIEYTPLPDEED